MKKHLVYNTEYVGKKLPQEQHVHYITQIARNESLYFIAPDELAIVINGDTIEYKINIREFLELADVMS